MRTVITITAALFLGALALLSTADTRVVPSPEIVDSGALQAASGDDTAPPEWSDLPKDVQSFIAGFVHGMTTMVLWSDPPQSDEQMAIMACVRQLLQEQMIWVLYTEGRWQTQDGVDFIPYAFESCADAVELFIEANEPFIN